MRGILRYGIVIIAAAGIIAACLILIPDRKKQPDTGSSSENPAPSFTDNEPSESEEPSESAASSSEESTADSGETGTEPSETDSESESETVISPEDPTEPTVMTEPQGGAGVGLSAYFKGKLSIDTDKVSEFLRVREQPDSESRVLTGIYPADILPYEWVDGRWLKVTKDGVSGYVRAEYVLIDDACMEAWISSVNYRAVMKDSVKEAFLYEKPDTGSSIIDIAKRYHSYQIIGMDTQFFEVYYHGTHYEKLYVKQSDVILYYEFTGNRGAENLMADWQIERFSKLDLSGNAEKMEIIEAESRMEESRIQASIEASIAESIAEEERRRAEEEAKRQAAIEARFAMAKRDGLGIEKAHLDFIPARFDDRLVAYTLNLCKKFGLSEHYMVIFAMICQESNFKTDDISGSGNNKSYGFLQIIPRFHKDVLEKYGVSDMMDPTSNLLVGLDIFSDYFHQEGNDINRALLRYRWGTTEPPAGVEDYIGHVMGHIDEWRSKGYSFEYRVIE